MSEKTANIGVVVSVALVQIVFIVLKLLNVIKWHWFWVFSPFWAVIGLILTVVSIAILLDK